MAPEDIADKVLNHLTEEWAVVTGAPAICILVVGVTGLAVWFIAQLHFKGIIATLSARVDLHKDRAELGPKIMDTYKGGKEGNSHAGISTASFDKDSVIAWIGSEYEMVGKSQPKDQWMNKKLNELHIPWRYASIPSGYKLTLTTPKWLPNSSEKTSESANIIPQIAGTWITEVGGIIKITQNGINVGGKFPCGSVDHEYEGIYDLTSGKFKMTTVRSDAALPIESRRYVYLETWELLDENRLSFDCPRNFYGKHDTGILKRRT